MNKSILLIILVILILFPTFCLPSETITGHYCYTYGDKESLQEAKEIVRTLAIRNAIEIYRVYVESTTRVTNFTLTNDLVQILGSGYLKNLKVIEHTEEGRTICERISGIVEPKDIEKVIEK
jgi:hypothetical protein